MAVFLTDGCFIVITIAMAVYMIDCVYNLKVAFSTRLSATLALVITALILRRDRQTEDVKLSSHPRGLVLLSPSYSESEHNGTGFLLRCVSRTTYFLDDRYCFVSLQPYWTHVHDLYNILHIQD